MKSTSRFLCALLTLALVPAFTQDEEEGKQEKKTVEERLDKVEKELKRVKKHVSEEKAKDASTDVIRAEFKDGLKLKADSGNFEMHVGGRLLEHVKMVKDVEKNLSTFQVRQARLEASGTLYKMFEFKVQGDFAGGAASLQDGYTGIKLDPAFNIRFGQFKQPFSIEETTSTRFIDFVERSPMNKFTPARDTGILFHGKLFEDVLKYEASVYNGSGRNTTDLNDGKDVAIRLTASFPKPRRAQVEVPQFAVAMTRGTRGDVEFSDVSTAETGVKFLDADVGVKMDGDVERQGFEIIVPAGAFCFRAEYMKAKFDLIEGTVRGDFEVTGWYASATYLLTGEQKPIEGRIKPNNNFSLKDGGWGAWEVAIRLSSLDLGDDLVKNGFTNSTVTTEDLGTMTLGVNWWLSPAMRISINYVREEYDNEIILLNEKVKTVTALLARFQIDF